MPALPFPSETMNHSFMCLFFFLVFFWHGLCFLLSFLFCLSFGSPYSILEWLLYLRGFPLTLTSGKPRCLIVIKNELLRNLFEALIVWHVVNLQIPRECSSVFGNFSLCWSDFPENLSHSSSCNSRILTARATVLEMKQSAFFYIVTYFLCFQYGAQTLNCA